MLYALGRAGGPLKRQDHRQPGLLRHPRALVLAYRRGRRGHRFGPRNRRQSSAIMLVQLQGEYRRRASANDDARACGCCSGRGAATTTRCLRSAKRSGVPFETRSISYLQDRSGVDEAVPASASAIVTPASRRWLAAAVARPGHRHRPADGAGRALDQAGRAAGARRSSGSAIRARPTSCSTWSSRRANIRSPMATMSCACRWR